MAAKYWIKLYHELLHERKMAQLSDRLWRRSVECFLMAGELNEGGVLPPLDDMAWTLRQTPEVLETELAELARIGLVEQRGGGWFVTNFAKRQAKMDKAEYMRRLRDERQKEQYYSEDSETLPDRYDKRYQPVTNSNADTDIDKIRIDKKPAPNGARPHETIHNMEMPPPPGPAADRADAVQEMVSHIAGAVKTVYAIGKNSDDFERVANALIDYGITTKQVDNFPAWWAVNGHYPGRPALKSLLDNIRDAADPLEPATVDTWGSDAIAVD